MNQEFESVEHFVNSRISTTGIGLWLTPIAREAPRFHAARKTGIPIEYIAPVANIIDCFASALSAAL